MQTDEFIEEVGARAAGGLSTQQARTATRATLETLAARISREEASDLAGQLSRELAAVLRAPTPHAQFSSNEFLDRVAEREGVSRSEALDHVRAVMNVLAEAVSPPALDHVRAELPSDYDSLFTPPAVVGRPDSHLAQPKATTEGTQRRHPSPEHGGAPTQVMHVDVAVRGPVPEVSLEQTRREIGGLARFIDGPILGARVVLTQEQNPRIERPARAEGEIDLPGAQVRARVAATAMENAIDELADRLKRRIRDRLELMITAHRVSAEPRTGEWHHGALPTARPEHFPRPPAEREIVRRKSYGIGPMDIAEAAASMDALDHDFFVFHDIDTGADAVLYRNDDGRLAVIDPAPAERAVDGPIQETSRFSEPVELETAVGEMDALDHRFLFFVNAATGRGNVIYTRHDGHYGVIEPADAVAESNDGS